MLNSTSKITLTGRAKVFFSSTKVRYSQAKFSTLRTSSPVDKSLSKSFICCRSRVIPARTETDGARTPLALEAGSAKAGMEAFFAFGAEAFLMTGADSGTVP